MKRAKREQVKREQVSIAALLKPLSDRFVAALEQQIAVQAQAILAAWFKRDAKRSKRPVRPVSPVAAIATPAPSTFQPAIKKRKTTPRPRPTVQAQSPDPVYAQRTAELNRLRSILRPVDDRPSTDGPPAEAPAPHRVETTDGMKSLEEEVRDGIAFLSVLSPARCEAQIAVWSGRARLYQEEQADGRTRIAAGLLLEKLRGLARAMDAGFIEALNPSFSTSDWGQYVSAKEKAAAAEPVASVPTSDGDDGAAVGGEFGDVWR